MLFLRNADHRLRFVHKGEYDAVREFAVCLTALSFIGAAVLVLTPDGELKKYVHLTLALVSIALVGSFLSNTSDIQQMTVPSVQIQDQSQKTEQLIISTAKQTSNERITDAISERFSIPPECISVQVDIEKDGSIIKVSHIYVKITGYENMIYTTRIKYWLTESFGYSVSVEYVE